MSSKMSWDSLRQAFWDSWTVRVILVKPVFAESFCKPSAYTHHTSWNCLCSNSESKSFIFKSLICSDSIRWFWEKSHTFTLSHFWEKNTLSSFINFHDIKSYHGIVLKSGINAFSMLKWRSHWSLSLVLRFENAGLVPCHSSAISQDYYLILHWRLEGANHTVMPGE